MPHVRRCRKSARFPEIPASFQAQMKIDKTRVVGQGSKKSTLVKNRPSGVRKGAQITPAARATGDFFIVAIGASAGGMEAVAN
jgi:chemotaxis response regulator CheB